EELIRDNGKITTTNLGEYKIPNIADIQNLRPCWSSQKGGQGLTRQKASVSMPTSARRPPLPMPYTTPAACGCLIFRLRRRKYSTQFETSTRRQERKPATARN